MKGKDFIVAETSLQITGHQDNLQALRVVTRAWAEATTDRTLDRREDLINDKSRWSPPSLSSTRKKYHHFEPSLILLCLLHHITTILRISNRQYLERPALEPRTFSTNAGHRISCVEQVIYEELARFRFLVGNDFQMFAEQGLSAAIWGQIIA